MLLTNTIINKNMKKYLLISFLAFILLFSNQASALTSTTTKNTVKDLKQKIVDIKQNTKENKEKIKNQIASTTSVVKTIKQELKTAAEIRIGKKLESKKASLANEFEKSLQNVKNLAIRTELRTQNMDSEKINTISSKMLLAVAKEKIMLAESELTKFENLLASTTIATSTDKIKLKARNDALKILKTESEKVKTAIKVAHESVVKVIVSLKKGLMEKQSASLKEIESTSSRN